MSSAQEPKKGKVARELMDKISVLTARFDSIDTQFLEVRKQTEHMSLQQDGKLAEELKKKLLEQEAKTRTLEARITELEKRLSAQRAPVSQVSSDLEARVIKLEKKPSVQYGELVSQVSSDLEPRLVALETLINRNRMKFI